MTRLVPLPWKRLIALGATLAAAPILLAQSLAPLYRIDFDPKADVALVDRDAAGTQGLFVKIQFKITVEGSAPAAPDTQYKVVIEENGLKVYEDDVPRPTPSDDLAVVLALDTSGSMREHGRMEKARAAAEYFLKRLPPKADCGLILFDHEIRQKFPLSVDRKPFVEAIQTVEPRGGTAYFDAAMAGIESLAKVPLTKKRYLVLLTDGVDLNSNWTADHVLDAAKKHNVHVMTIGIGEPGRREPVNTVLVLDQSLSMARPIAKNVRKIDALKLAARRFVEIVPSYGWVSILAFDDVVHEPTRFSNDRVELSRVIQSLDAEGGTSLLDAILAAQKKVASSKRPGRNAIVVMTDGIDSSEGSLGPRIDRIVANARELKVPLHTLGFGRDREIDLKLLDHLATQSKGRPYHAKDEQSLLQIFENLSIQLHDDGIDEETLQRIAAESLGQYFPVKNISELRLILERVNDSIQHKSYEVIFPSKLQRRDGTRRTVSVKLVRRTGETVSNTSGGIVSFGDEVIESRASGYQTHGLIAAEMSPLVYLGFLTGIAGLLAAPRLLQGRDGLRRR